MSQYFQHYSDVALSLVGFFLFATVFLGWVVITGLKSNRDVYESIAKKMLNDGDQT